MTRKGKSMHWEYRVVRRDGALSIYEVFFDDDGRIASHTVDPVPPTADTVADLRYELEQYLRALDSPIIDYMP